MEDKTDADDVTVHAAVPRDSDDPEAFLVEYPDGEFAHEPATPENQLLFDEGKYAEIDGCHEFTVNATDVLFEANVSIDSYALMVGDHQWLTLTDDDREEAVDLLLNESAPGESLLDLYYDVREDRAREEVVCQFLDRFPTQRLAVTDNGFEVDETFVVTWEGDNHLINVAPGDPYGDERLDRETEAVAMNLPVDGREELVTPSGDTVELMEVEQEVLLQIEALLFPGDYFGAELVDEVEQYKAEANTKTVDDLFDQMAEQVEDTGFTDPKTGNYHGSDNHPFDKHRLTTDLGVTQEAVDLLWANDFDHAGVHELLMRRGELEVRDDVDVFQTTTDDDPDKWAEVQSVADNAPIMSETRRKLEEMYGA